jgi:hypothetical protein
MTVRPACSSAFAMTVRPELAESFPILCRHLRRRIHERAAPRDLLLWLSISPGCAVTGPRPVPEEAASLAIGARTHRVPRRARVGRCRGRTAGHANAGRSSSTHTEERCPHPGGAGAGPSGGSGCGSSWPAAEPCSQHRLSISTGVGRPGHRSGGSRRTLCRCCDVPVESALRIG